VAGDLGGAIEHADEGLADDRQPPPDEGMGDRVVVATA